MVSSISSGPHSRRIFDGALALASGAASFPLFAWLFFTLPSLPDLDSYYHLAVARLYAGSGLVRGLQWARFSVLGEALGDKELLFHLFLAPFSSSAAGGRIALALLNAAVVAVVGWLAVCAAGRSAAFTGIWIVLTAGAFAFRTFRLRPEIGALLLLLALVELLARRRARCAGVVCALFVLSYTSWHVPLGLAVLITLVTREKRWKMIAFPLIGTVAGILAHPHFPDNVRTFWIQNVIFFLRKGTLDVGSEIHAPWIRDLLAYNAGFWLGLAAIVFFHLRERRSGAGASPTADERHRAIAFTTAAAVFLLLFLFMERMAVYAIPFTALAVLQWVRSIPRPALLVLLLSVSVSAPWTMELLKTTRDHSVSEPELRSFGAAVPDGAKIAATWGAAEAYCYWAPQGRYLNLLDPVFMAERWPRQYAAQRAVFEGDEPDVPTTVQHVLDSQAIAFRTKEIPRTLFERLRNDPRSRLLHSGENFLVSFAPTNAFVSGWSGAGLAAGHETAWVDLSQAATPCAVVTATVPAGTYELAAWGPSALAVEGGGTVPVGGVEGVLGRGLRFAIAAQGRVAVRSCRGRLGKNGFYFVRR